VIQHTYAGIAAHEAQPMRIRTRLVGRPTWKLMQLWLRLFGGPKARAVLSNFEQYAPYTRISGVFDNSREAALLARYGVVLPDRDEFFARAVAYALATNFGRRRTRTARVSRSEGQAVARWEKTRSIHTSVPAVRLEGVR
jgi:hypothetical protein